MRVKLLLALAIASVLLFCSAGVTLASVCDSVPTSCSGIPTAEQLTAAANNEIAAFGFPDLSSVGTTDAVVPADCIDATTLDAPLCGVCGECPPCECTETTTVIPGPEVNLGCPLITTFAVPVNLVSPTIKPVFPSINVAPQVCLGLPQVNTQLNCFDIDCQPCTSINECPTCVTPCPTTKPTVR
jgi:hypothetical protein